MLESGVTVKTKVGSSKSKLKGVLERNDREILDQLHNMHSMSRAGEWAQKQLKLNKNSSTSHNKCEDGQRTGEDADNNNQTALKLRSGLGIFIDFSRF